MGSTVISEKAIIGKNVVIKDGAIIEDGVCIGDGSFIDYRAILKENVQIGEDSFIGADCILGEYLGDFFEKMQNKPHLLHIGNHARIRSGTIIYGDTTIGNHFQTGHRATIREQSKIGDHVSIGTLSDIQGHCSIGNNVRLHSNVHIGQSTIIHDSVWIFPYVITTNDPLPPSDIMLGVEIFEYACVCAGSIILPGKKIGRDALVGAGSVVTKDVRDGIAVVGNPAREMCRVSEIKDSEGDPHYPWRDYFERG